MLVAIGKWKQVQMTKNQLHSEIDPVPDGADGQEDQEVEER